MADLFRVHRRLPFGIKHPRRLLIGALVIGGGAVGVGYPLHNVGLTVTGVCVLMTVPFFAMAFAWARNTPSSLAVRDEGFEVVLSSRTDVLPWSEITGVTLTRARGAGLALFLERAAGRYTIGVASYPQDQLDKLVAQARQRLAA